MPLEIYEKKGKKFNAESKGFDKVFEIKEKGGPTYI